MHSVAVQKSEWSLSNLHHLTLIQTHICTLNCTHPKPLCTYSTCTPRHEHYGTHTKKSHTHTHTLSHTDNLTVPACRKQLMETWPVNTYNSQEFGIPTAVIIWPHTLPELSPSSHSALSDGWMEAGQWDNMWFWLVQPRGACKYWLFQYIGRNGNNVEM